MSLASAFRTSVADLRRRSRKDEQDEENLCRRDARAAGGIALVGTPSPAAQQTVADPAAPVCGPFSADFKWATLPDISGTPIRCTDGQAKVFRSLWSFKGEATTAERIMQRAGLDSAKPSDLFKIKPKDKGKPEPVAQHAAYGALVVTQQRAGLYSMPCAAGALA